MSDCCLVPGQIVVVPRDGAAFSELKQRLEVEYTAFDLGAHENDKVTDRAGAPIVARVPPGEEDHWAEHFSRKWNVAAALPNHRVAPQSAITINEGALSSAIREVGAAASIDSAGVTVAVFDSGYAGPTSPSIVTLDACGAADPVTPRAAAHGTLACNIVSRVVPSAQIVSVRVMGSASNVATLLTGLYMAESGHSPDVFNFSLRIAMDDDRCRVCGDRSRRQRTSAPQLGLACQALTRRASGANGPVWVAAAGNNTRSVSLPASLENVIAVGAFDARRGEVAPYALYDEVPPERFLLAPGGASSREDCFAHLSTPPDQFLYGTSFAAPIVSGLVARLLADASSPVPRHQRTLPWILECLRASANRDFPGFDPRKHGLGRARTSSGGWPAVSDAFTSHIYSPGNATMPAFLRQQVEERAYQLWAAEGRPSGRDLELWLRA